MLFSSSAFIFFFLPIVLIIYYGLLKNKRQAQNIFLLISSLVFYAWGEPVFVLIMMLSIVANYLFGLKIYKCKKKENERASKGFVFASVVFNLSLLFVFKYLTFTLDTIANLSGRGSFGVNIALPIGISFFTFQSMSYVLDVYRGRGGVLKNILNVGLYISFFPQLIAGPIVRYETIATEIADRKETREDFYEGFSRFIVGLGKKVLLANFFAVYADNAFANVGGLSLAMSWIGAVSYAFQIFFDFSGYSDMAIGLGRMFGFHFLENLNYPYISKSVSEFWRRWHISLGTWFKDYVYVPMGGSRVKKPRLVFNLFVVWMLTGIWHGANWTFFVWGFMYFVLLSIEKLTGFGRKERGKAASVFGWIYTMLFVIIGWVIFRANTLSEAFEYLKVMFGFVKNVPDTHVFANSLKGFFIYLVFAILFSAPIMKKLENKYENSTFFYALRAVSIVLIFIIAAASIVSSSHNPFIYFNF